MTAGCVKSLLSTVSVTVVFTACSDAPKWPNITCSVCRDKEPQADFHIPNNGIMRRSDFVMVC